MKVGHKVLVPPLVAIASLLLLGAVCVVLMARQGITISTLIKSRGGSISLALAAAQETGQVQTSAYGTFLAASSIGEEAIRTTAANQAKRLDTLTKRGTEYLAMPSLHPKERELAQAAQDTLAGYRKHLATAMGLALSDPAAATQALQASEAAFQKLAASYGGLAELQTQLAAESSAQGAADFRSMVLAIVAIALFAGAASLAMAIVMSRRVVRPLQTATRAAGDVARGDLRFDIQVHGHDETADLLRAQAKMQQELRRLVSEVVTGARAVSEASAQMAQGNQDLSQRTETQASTLEETASSIEELTSTVTQNAENARQASQLALGASEVARKGGDVVGEVVSTMSGISQSSRRIEDIIGVIDGIAFQTNILALNAAVEAARAGEQGRGFAVVASEVRSLAQRSAAAAKEIKGLIGDSVAQVAAGTRLVDTAGETMKEIVSSVRKVSDLIAEIAAASQEQSSGIEQVSLAIAQMDQVVQQNASLVEEATAGAEAMQARAGGLLQAVSWFQLDAAATAYTAEAPQPVGRLPAIGLRTSAQAA